MKLEIILKMDILVLLGVAIIIVYKALDNFGDVVDVIGKFLGL